MRMANRTDLSLRPIQIRDTTMCGNIIGEELTKQRNHPQLEIKNLSVDASDGVGFFQGVISDVSRFGVCLTDLPKKLNGKAKIMTVVVNGQGKNSKMSARL